MTKKVKKYLFLLPLLLLSSCNDNANSSSSNSQHIDIPQQILNTLKQDLVLQIDLEKSAVDKQTDEKSNVEQTKMKTYLGSEEYWNYEYVDDLALNESHYFKNSNGNVVKKMISMDNQSIVEEEVYLYGETLIFDEVYYNPFKSLTKSQIKKINDSTYTISDLSDEQLESIHVQLTLYYGMIATIDIIVDENGIVQSLTYEAYYDYGDYSPYLIGYAFNGTFLNKSELEIKNIEVRPHQDYHDPLQEKLNLLQNQNYAFTYTKIDPDGKIEDEIYDVTITSDMIFVHHIKKGVIDEYGWMNTESGLVKFSVEETDDAIYFNALGKENSSLTIQDYLNDFSLSAEAISFNGIDYYLDTGYGFYSYLDHFLPNQCVEDLKDARVIDDGSLTLSLEDDQMAIHYTISGNLWEARIVVTQFSDVQIPYDSYIYQPFTNPTSWEEMEDFYNELLTMMDESLISEIPFYYPEKGWDTTLLMAFMNTAMLRVDL